MKRFELVPLTAALALALLAGCAPSGTDEDLADDWPAMAAAKPREPAVGDCYLGDIGGTLTMTESCTVLHTAETVFVGALGPDAAASSTPPRGAALRDAWAACDKGATAFLGEEWRNGRVELFVFPPTVTQWGAGVRSYRCDLAEVRSERGKAVERTSSVKDGLRGDRPLARGCSTVQLRSNKEIDDFTFGSCTDVHQAEYAGVFVASEGPFPTSGTRGYDELVTGCREVVAKYIGVGATQFDAMDQLDFTWWWAGEEGWVQGNRTVKCHLRIAEAAQVRRSLKGNGSRPI